MRIRFSKQAEKEFYKLDKPIQKQLKKFIEKLTQLEDPRSRGKALTANLAGLWRYRVGKYRLICKIIGSELVILVVDIAHRNDIYDE